jgi:hypothetical protein
MSERSDRFFTWVWRVNGLLLLALAVLGVIGATALIFNTAVFFSRDRDDKQLTQVAGADLKAKDLRLGAFRTIAGTQLLYAPLAPPSEYIGSGSSGGLGSARNLLFFDTTTKKVHWLLPENDHTIESFSFLMDPPAFRHAYADGEADNRDQLALAILLQLKPPRADRVKTAARTLALASPAGRNLTEIAASTDGLLGYHQPAKETVLVFYVSAGAARVLDVDVVTRKVRSDTVLQK